MSEDNIPGAIFDGGQSKRMGQNKFFLQLNGKTLIEHSIDKVKKHLQKVIIIKNLEFEIKDYDPFFNINTIKDLEFAKKLSTKLENEKK